MTKEELIRILDKQKLYEVDKRGRLIEYSKDSANPSRIYIDLFNLVMDLGDISIDENTAQPTPNWIPCSERLPVKEGIYIVTDDASNIPEIEKIAVTKKEYKTGKFL